MQLLQKRAAVVVATLIALGHGPAHAQSAGDKVAAETLFNDARKLMAEKRWPEACAKLEASQKLDPAPGTQLNLADCSEKAGKTASAWVQFLEAASLAKSAGDAKREKAARDRARALEPKLIRLTIEVPQAAAAVPGLEITRDGAKVDRALWGSSVPIDPGEHTLSASAKGRKPWSTKIDASAAGKSLTVQVPALDEEPAPPPVVAPPPPASASPPRPTETAPPRPVETAPVATLEKDAPPSSSQRTWALVAGGVGVVGVGVGTFLALSAKSTFDDATSHCQDGKSRCDEEGASLSRDAKSKANLATLAFAVGGVGLAGAAVLWLTAPPSTATAGNAAPRRYYVAPAAAPDRAGVLVGGRFLDDGSWPSAGDRFVAARRPARFVDGLRERVRDRGARGRSDAGRVRGSRHRGGGRWRVGRVRKGRDRRSGWLGHVG